MEKMNLFPLEFAKKIKRVIPACDFRQVNNALEQKEQKIILAGVTANYDGNFLFLLLELED